MNVNTLTVGVQRTELAAGSDVQAAAVKEGRAEVSHRLLDGGESRRPKGASNPPRVRVRWNEVLGQGLHWLFTGLDPFPSAVH
jgi:hypothetical protein